MNEFPLWTIATTDVGCADRSGRGTVIATGTEVVPLLQGVVTSDLFALADEGSGQRSTATNSNGRMVCDLRFVHVPDLLIMDFEPGLVEGGVISHFRANVMMEDARFVDRSKATARLCVIGPRAADLLSATAELDKNPAQLPVYHATWGTLAGHDVIAQRIPDYGVPAFDLYLAAEARDEVRDAIDAPELDFATLEALRVDAGVPRWGAELDEKVIPLEAGLDFAIAFDKGCYVGQEIIARLDTLGTPAKRLRTLVFEEDVDDAPSVGEAVTRDGKKAGEVRSVAYSPKRGRWIALAYVKRGSYELDTEVEVTGTQATVKALGHTSD